MTEHCKNVTPSTTETSRPQEIRARMTPNGDTSQMGANGDK